MTDDEKDEHIRVLEERVGVLDVQVKALYSLFLEIDPSDPNSGTKAKRIMDVVKAVERSNWAAKMIVYIFLTLGSLAAAWTAIRGGFTK